MLTYLGGSKAGYREQASELHLCVCLQDQKQYFRVNSGRPYWYNPSKSHFVTAAEFAELFRTSHLGQAQRKRLTTELDPRQQASNVSNGC